MRKIFSGVKFPLTMALTAGWLATGVVHAAERKPPLSQEPAPRGTKFYADYKPQPPAPVRDEVLRGWPATGRSSHDASS